jgi:hypothetical protein
VLYAPPQTDIVGHSAQYENEKEVLINDNAKEMGVIALKTGPKAVVVTLTDI